MKCFICAFSLNAIFSVFLLGSDTAIKTHFSGPTDGALSFADDGRPATLRILTDNNNTGGRFSAMESVFPPGYDGPGMHFHKDTIQAIYVRSGKFIVRLLENGCERRVEMTPGSFLSIAPGTPHSFLNPHNDSAIALVIDAPGNLVDMFRSMAEIGKSTDGQAEKEAQLHRIRWETYDNHQVNDENRGKK
jgi:quercetin dioxygenase-like cupin family protein